MRADRQCRRNGAPTLYAHADVIEGEIAGGRFAPYARLLSGTELMRRFVVSRVTVRAAIALLARKGLVHVRQGKGTFVAGPVLRQPLDRFTGLHDVLAAHGVKADRRLLEFRPATTDECARTPFESPGAERPTLLRRLYSLQGTPLAVVHGLIGPALASMTRGEAASQTIGERLALHAVAWPTHSFRSVHGPRRPTSLRCSACRAAVRSS